MTARRSCDQLMSDEAVDYCTGFFEQHMYVGSACIGYVVEGGNTSRSIKGGFSRSDADRVMNLLYTV